MNDINKQMEDIIKAEIKSVEKMWKEVDGENTFTALLEKMTKDELVKVAKKYNAKGLTSLKKADAVEKVKSIIIEDITIALNLIEENTLRFLEALIKENGNKVFQAEDMIALNYLRNRGIAFSVIKNEEAIVILPEEVRVKLQGIITKEFRNSIRLNDEIIKVIAGMTYYYGVVSFEHIKSNLDLLFNKKFEDTYIKELIINGEELGYDYVIEDDLLCHIDVEDTEAIISLQSENNNEFYKFDKKSLILAGKPDFVEDNKYAKKLERVMSELFVIDKEILRNEMDGFFFAIKNEVEKLEAIDIFLEAYEIESDEERKIFEEELNVLAKSIRKWSLKGYSEDEIEKSNTRVVNEVRIGRNDPCTCGSGKKYKKCCGK